MNLKALYEKRARVHHNMADIIAQASKEERLMNAEENQKWTGWNSEFDALTNQIRVHEAQAAQAALMAETNRNMDAHRAPGAPEIVPRKRESISYTDTFWKYVKRGYNGLTDDEKRVLDTKRASLRGTDPQTTTDGAGGYTIAEGFSGELEQVVVDYSGMLQACRVLQTTSGNPLKWPKIDDSAVTSAKKTEGSAITVVDWDDTEVEFNAYTYAALIKITEELMNDTSIPDFQREMAFLLGERQGRAINNALTVGDGSGDPNGIANATVGKTAAATNAITRAEIVDLVHSVDIYYRNSSRAMFQLHDTTLAAIKKLTIGASDGRPLWQPSIAAGEPDRIDGKPYIVNNDMANVDSGAASVVMVFGDMNKYIIRRAGKTILRRSDDRYFEEMNIALLIADRYDGDFINSTAIKSLKLAAS